MKAQEVDDYFYRDAGPVWGELRGGLWHRTGSHLFREILNGKEVHADPVLPRGEFQWKSAEGNTYCRSIGGVSLFDFVAADWDWYFQQERQSDWVQFLRAPATATPADKWIATVWLAIDSDRLPKFISISDISADRNANAQALRGKWMPYIEACSQGPLPLAACTHVVIVCAVEPKEFKRMALHPFDLAELDRVEADWRDRFAKAYESRALSVQERIEGLNWQLPDSYKPDRNLAERLREANSRLEALRTKQRGDPPKRE